MITSNSAGTLTDTIGSSEVEASDGQSIVTIQRRSSWIGTNFRELWAYRELLYFLAWRDVKVRYKQTVLGVAWVVLQPLLMTIVFTIFLGKLVRVPSNNVPYPLFAYAGLMVWTFFSTAIASTGNSLVGNAHLITKVFFPRLLIPISSVLARLVDFGVSFLILIALLIYYRVHLSAAVFALPVLIVMLAFFTLALGMWVAAINVKYRDIGLAIPVFIQLGMFVTPVVYPLSLVPSKWQPVYSLNPMVGIIENLRAALFGQPFEQRSLILALVITVLLFMYATYVFRKREQTFADII